jgi:hypothetical protein
MFEDGVSTTNTLGQGLGAIRRLSDFCDAYSLKGWGTIILARFFRNAKEHGSARLGADIRSIVLAKPGETACGDGVAISANTNRLRILVGDGLGHGPEAQKVVSKAEAAFMSTREDGPSEMLRAVHEGVRRSRGLVATIAVYDFAERIWRVTGVGNISTWIGTAISGRSVLAYNGILGVNIPNSLSEQCVEHHYGQILIMFSDGFRNRFDLQSYPGILRHDLSILASALYRDFGRRTDDMSVLIARITQKP